MTVSHRRFCFKEAYIMKLTLNTEKRHEVSPYLYMQFMEPLAPSDGSVDAAWNYVLDDWHADFIKKMKELSPPMIRFGGCFASYYKWKEAVGPRNERIPMLNLSWDGWFSNQVGTAELCDLCVRSDSEPLIVVNMECDGRKYWENPKPGVCRFADEKEAAEWVSYCNDPDNTLRKSHGREEPYNVKFWQIGNETSYKYDVRQWCPELEKPMIGGYGLEEAIDATRRFAKAMREASPSEIKLIAWGDSGWASAMCEAMGNEVEYIAFHHHFDSGLERSPLNSVDYRKDPENTWKHLMNAYVSLEKKIGEMRASVEPYGKRLAMTEGHFALRGRNRCEVLSSWGAGVAYARCLLTIERASDIIDIATMADFFGTRWQVNTMMIQSPQFWGKPYLQPVGHVMQLFSHHTGKYALDLSFVDFEGLDMTSFISEDGKKIYLHAVNTKADKDIELDLDILGKEIISAKAYEISADPMTEITPISMRVFDVKEKEIQNGKYLLPAAAVSAIEIEI